jgi:formate-dependent nitrite reductase membrane component NrfD
MLNSVHPLTGKGSNETPPNLFSLNLDTMNRCAMINSRFLCSFQRTFFFGLAPKLALPLEGDDRVGGGDAGMRTEPIHLMRHTKVLGPQQEWKEIIAIYLYLAGMGAGSYIIGTLINWFTDPSRLISILGFRVDVAKAALLWGPILVAIGAPFLILDLGIKKRFLYAALNPRTSWVARGFLILSIFIVFGLALMAKFVLPFEWFHPKSSFWYLVESITLIFAFSTALYTGILLKATKSIPLWNTYLLPLLFLVSALSTGSMAIILSTLAASLFSLDATALKILMGAEQILVVIEGVVLFLYLSRRYRASEQGKDSVRLLLFGEKRLLFWGGVVLLGFIFPVVLESISSLSHGNPVLIFAAGVVLLSGGFFLRLGVISAGIREQIPMHRLMEMKYDLAKNPKSEYRNIHSVK